MVCDEVVLFLFYEKKEEEGVAGASEEVGKEEEKTRAGEELWRKGQRSTKRFLTGNRGAPWRKVTTGGTLGRAPPPRKDAHQGLVNEKHQKRPNASLLPRGQLQPHCLDRLTA